MHCDKSVWLGAPLDKQHEVLPHYSTWVSAASETLCEQRTLSTLRRPLLNMVYTCKSGYHPFQQWSHPPQQHFVYVCTVAITKLQIGKLLHFPVYQVHILALIYRYYHNIIV